MSISVIIPAYNYAHFLSETLHSVLQQNLCGLELEVIIVDDGSTDDTKNVVRTLTPQFEKTFGRGIHYIYQQNAGLSSARTTGLQAATGEALVFLDADDMLLPGVLASQWQNLKNNPQSHMSVCRNYMANAQNQCWTLQGYYPLFTSDFVTHLCCANVAPVHAFMVLRSKALQVGGFDTTLKGCEDYDFWLKCVMAEGHMVGNPHAGVIYRKHGGGMSAQSESQARHEAICNGRVAHMLQTQPHFLAHRRLEAYMAHVYGSFKRIEPLWEYDEPLALALLEQGTHALIHALELCKKNSSQCVGNDFQNIGTLYPRSVQEQRVLQYYIIKSLIMLHAFALFDVPMLQTLHAQLLTIFPQYNKELNELHAQITNLLAHLHESVDLENIVDQHGHILPHFLWGKPNASA